MIKKNFNKVLDFYNAKSDFTLTLKLQNGILSCRIYIPKGMETFCFQEVVEGPDFETISFDFKEFQKLINDKVRAKFPFHFSFDSTSNILSVIEEQSTEKCIAKIKYTLGGDLESGELNTPLFETKINAEDFSNVQLHDTIRTNLELYPEFMNVSCRLEKNALLFLSTDLTCFLATHIALESNVPSLHFSMSTNSIKNLKNFQNQNVVLRAYEDKDYLLLEIEEKNQSEDNRVFTTRYVYPCEKTVSSFYDNSAISSCLDSLTKTSYTPLLELSKEELTVLKDACTNYKKESMWNDKRSVIFTFYRGVMLEESLLLDLPSLKIQGEIAGYHLTSLLTIPTVTKNNRKKIVTYCCDYSMCENFEIFKNGNVYLVKQQTKKDA